MVRHFSFNAAELPFRVKEALRYSGSPATEEFVRYMGSCRDELVPAATPAVCCRILPVIHIDGGVNIGGKVLRSRDLAKNLRGCDSVLIMAATLGVGVDRVILAASRMVPSKAVLLQGVAAEMIESLCDKAETSLLCGRRSRPRFSPGYGDLTLDAQRMIFGFLSPEKYIGLTLNTSLMLSPAKSVTAFVGIMKEGGENNG